MAGEVGPQATQQAAGPAQVLRVAAGDELVLLESMKMEIPVLTEGPGRIAEVKVTAGDVVQEGEVLVVIDD